MTYNIKVFGIVQGVGFRPFIKNLADSFFVTGTVANKGSYVEIFAQGNEIDLQKFIAAITKNAPPRSTILKLDFAEIFTEKTFTTFEIVESEREAGDIFVSPDIAICENCAAELFDKNNRRYLHPFINCTACGPRLTILENMPYDRERTSMKIFPMCKNCSAEYFSPESRRFDAQPVCCNDCGPKLKLGIRNEELGISDFEIIKKIRKIIVQGGIVAIKGIGGFHLACDAKNFSAVQKLRESKTRPTKPFAVMFKNISAVEKVCQLSDAEKIFLDSPQKPIILLRKKFPETLAENVAPEINKLGAMLPYTPLHLLLFDLPDDLKNFPDALVMTSGNPSGVPITIDDADALKNFGDFCDEILTNDRKILLRADDSVMDFCNDKPAMIRRSRGFAPLPIFVNRANKTQVLALGGELKNTFCLAKNNLLYASPYIGDVGDLRTVEVLQNSIARLSDLLEIAPEKIICDTHPRYQTVQLAEKIAAEKNLPLEKIQHHYAHILTCLAENNFCGEVIGVSFDGTGYGDDGTIWGGEFFVCDAKSYRRVDSISSFVQAGGDLSSREGWRISISMLKKFPDAREIATKLNLADAEKISGQMFLLEKNLNCVESTSCGRLFDAVSAVLGICKKSSYEGEGAMRLQAAAMRNEELGIRNDFVSTQDLFEKIVERRLSGENIFALANFFHVGLSEIVVQKVEQISAQKKINVVALGGGVFQNTLLTNLVAEKLQRRNFKILLNKMIPTNDGGICIGQAFHAVATC